MSKLIEYFNKINAWFERSYQISWVGHFLWFFCSSLLLIFISWIFSFNLINVFIFNLGGALYQEGTQFQIYGINKKNYIDYIMDLVSDIFGIFLALVLTKCL